VKVDERRNCLCELQLETGVSKVHPFVASRLFLRILSRVSGTHDEMTGSSSDDWIY
jgi:hypothetical protein